jgi:hypothetical protein
MAERIIEIKKNAAGGLIFRIGAANADPLHVDPDDTLGWTSNVGHFSVFFIQEKSPFKNKARIRSDHKGETTQPLKIRFAKTGEVNPGFTYKVAVLDAATDTLITKDPDIILDDVGGD